MEHITISLEELTHYGESTARTMPVTGIVPRTAAEDTVRYALRSLREAYRRYARVPDAELSESGRWLADNLWLCEREGQAARAAFHAAGRLRTTCEGVLVLALCRVLLASGGGTTDEARIEAFLEGFQKKTPLTARELSLFGAALRVSLLCRLAQLYRGGVPEEGAVRTPFTALRTLSSLDLAETLEQADAVERLFRQDPVGVYPRMDERSRRDYRARLSLLAQRKNRSELRTAEDILRLAGESTLARRRHIGYYLYEKPLGKSAPKRSGTAYILANAALTLAAAAVVSLAGGSAAAGLLALLPLSQLVKHGLDRLILRTTPPRHLPRLELSGGVPDEGRTLCVISVLLTGKKSADAALRRLEEFRAASRGCGENLLFGLLCDLPESGETLSHEDAALLRYTAGAARDGTYVFTRERLWSRDSGKFAPWERKRGAVLELCRYLAGEASGLRLCAGDAQRLRGTVYLLTLDADTRLEPESARALIGTALHPLNRPAVDPKKGIVYRGHGVLHPRIAVSLESAYRNDFTRLFAPEGGGDPYGSDTGEVYMDAFQSGGFAGKGLIHIASYLMCLGGRIPENRVLSHDALEGAFLRGGYVSDVELTDGFPSGAVSYFARAHRWVRGDVQNLPWLFRAGRYLPAIERWRLFDSFRRALLPAGLFAALAAWFLAPGQITRLPALLALLLLSAPVLHYISGVLFRPAREVRQRSAALHGLGGALTRALTGLLFLAEEAWVSVSAIALALWRMGISHRRLLQWQTAEQSEKRRGGAADALAAMWPVVFFSGLLLAVSATFSGRAAAIVWIGTPFFSAQLGKAKPQKPLDNEERAFLLRRAAEIWRYFRETCTAAEHFLPPDNVQLSPPAETAHRTSPTNIGMALAAALSALELGVAAESEALGLCENLLDTLERLPRWEGHFYNWYDTRTLAVLSPAYVSTVDSGNLAAALLAVSAGLRAHGAPQLAARADALREAMNFRPLYDTKRRLFRIGLLPGESAPAQSWYDLLESEERLTAYYAIASGQIERRHWQKLSRAQVSFRRQRGMVSWSGSLFEYLMPELFLPLYRGSHLWESAKFAVGVQRRRPPGGSGFWGISESAFYAFDASGHYRYKAHGCVPLSLCRGMGRESVLSPYSSYLALCAAPHAAAANLRRMADAGLSGPYGLWEAVDYTPSRAGSGGIPVRCVMAHHLGMSLCAIANALCGGVLCRWFMSDPAMAAYAGLLQEKIPLGGSLLHREHSAAERVVRPASAPTRTGEGTDVFFPDAAALSNGAYRLLVTASGVSRASCGTLLPYRSARTPWEPCPGIALWYESGGVRRALLSPDGRSTLRWRFTAGEAVLAGESEGLFWEMRCTVSRAAPGELRRVTLRRSAAAAGYLYFGFEPMLLPARDYTAHPAFARLGLCTAVTDGTLVVYRAPRGTQSAQHLALCVSQSAEFSSDFRVFPARGGAGEFQANTGWQNEPYVAARVTLPESETCEILFSLCTASDETTAVQGARGMLSECSGFAMADAAAAVWGMDAHESAAAMEYLRALAFPQPCAAARSLPGAARGALWRHGISGDLPVELFDCGEGDTDAAIRELWRHALLGACGMEYDLLFLTAPAGDYRSEQRAAIEAALDTMRLSETLSLPGGVYFAPRSEREALLLHASLFGDETGITLPAARKDRRFRLPPPGKTAAGAPDVSFAGDDSVSFQTPPLPPRAWANMLYGGGLGCAVSDTGPAALWYENARECPILPWSGDALAAEMPERLWLETPEGSVSLFAGDGACRVTYGFGYARWEKSIGGIPLAVTAFLPPETPVRVLLFESGAPCEIHWFAPVQLAPEAVDAAAAQCRRDGGALLAENPRCPYPSLRLTARCSAPWESTGTSAEYLCGVCSDAPRRGYAALAGSFRVSGHAVLLLGTTDAPALLDTARAQEALGETKRFWVQRVCRKMNSDAMPAAVRHMAPWSVYAALCCRVLGRGSLYQSGGAIGFRDQLQDRINLLPADAAGARAHLIAVCAHQYTDGDVQHWYHPGLGETDRGVRTTCSDDLLWLPWAVCEYVRATGDLPLCAETAPYIVSPPLAPGERSRYEQPALSGEHGTVLEHCHRAAALVLRRGVGAHQLLLMGGGDWNDGFDDMGEGAESVWLTWFASAVFHNFSALLAQLGEPGAERYETAAAALGAAANEAWDTDHYLRGYYADGTPLGASGAESCRIDSVAQSFAAFSPYADKERVQTALTAALAALRDGEPRLLRLYTPPFPPEGRAPGYVRTYGPGFRENGGQYTHAAVWLALALLRAGRRAEAEAAAEDIALALRAPDYGAEPYVLPADIAAAPGKTGRAGWSWYTGAAGWYVRLLRELYGGAP